MSGIQTLRDLLVIIAVGGLSAKTLSIKGREALAVLDRVERGITLKLSILDDLQKAETERDALRAKLEKAKEHVALVSDTFKTDIQQGYKTKDKEFAIEILRLALAELSADAPAQPPQSNETDAEMLNRLGDDASKWAAEFNATAQRIGYQPMDEGWLICWFANAIEHSDQVRRAKFTPESPQISDEMVEAGWKAWCSAPGAWFDEMARESDLRRAMRATILAALEVERKK